MLTPYKKPALLSGALVSLSYQEMQDAANSLWNLVAIRDQGITTDAVVWVDANYNAIQAVHDKLIHALASLDAAEKAGS